MLGGVIKQLYHVYFKSEPPLSLDKVMMDVLLFPESKLIM